MKLTPGERLVRCLTGQSVDRIPFGVGLGWAPWGQTMARWEQELGRKIDLAKELGFDPGFAFPAAHFGFLPAFEETVISEDADFIITRDGRGITVKNRRDGMSMPDFLDHPIKTEADWEQVKVERLDPNVPRVTEDWPAFRARLARTGEAVQVGTFPWGVFGTIRDLLGVEETLLAFYDRPAMIKDMMQHMTTIWLGIYEEIARHVRIDHLHIWEDMSGRQGSLISPAMVEEFMMPCYDRITAFARRAGVRVVSVDTDGYCGQLVPVMMRHGINMFMPFEVQAGNDIFDFRQRYPTLGIWGGLDKRALADNAGPAAIDREVDKARMMLRQHRFVPMFDHLIPPDVPWEHFQYAARRFKELCYTMQGESVCP